MFFASLWVLTITICGFFIFSRNHHNCIKIITIVCSFIIMTSSCLYLPYLGGQAFTKVNDLIVGQPKKPIQPTHESPLPPCWDPKLSELRPRTCVFFFLCFGSWLGRWLLTLCFPTDNSWDPERKCHKCHQPHKFVKPEAWIHQEIHGLIGNPSPSLRRFIGCHKYDVIRPEVMRENVHTKLRVLSMNSRVFFTPGVSSSSFVLREKPSILSSSHVGSLKISSPKKPPKVSLASLPPRKLHPCFHCYFCLLSKERKFL